MGKDRCAKIKRVSKDLHAPYASSCAEYIPDAIEVADPFHVVKKLNDTMDECRKELSVASVLPVGKRKAIFRLNWVLRYKQENQSERNRASLEELAKINEPLYLAYLHKEAFYDFFSFRPSEIGAAEAFFISWIVEVFKSKLNALQEFAEYIKRNTRILLNIILTERSSAISEGINRKIQVLKPMAYGYRNLNSAMLTIMQRCGVLGSMWRPSN